MMPLYKVPRNTYIQLDGDIYFFHHLDGAYSLCEDMKGNIVHLAAWADVDIIKKETSAS